MPSARERNNVKVKGQGDTPLVFAHGLGCDQTMWRDVAPGFEAGRQVVLYDLTGAGESDLSAYDFERHGELQGHADDLIAILDELALGPADLVGHSVSATIVALTALKRPDLVRRLVLLAPSPCFQNDGAYRGGFDPADLEGLVAFMAQNYLGWSEQLAPTIVGRPAGDQSAETLTKSFCRTDPDIAQHFGRVTFLADHRADFARLTQPALVVQVADDAIAPQSVGEWLKDNVPGATLVVLETTGHCPHLTDPEATAATIRSYLGPNSG